MTSKEKPEAAKDCLDEDFPTLGSMNVSSATECTGLMYRPPQSQDELDSYQELYDLEYSEEDEGV